MNNYESLMEFLRPFANGADGFIGFTKADRSQVDEEDNKRWGDFTNWFGETSNGEVDLPFEVLSENPRWEYYFTPAILSEASRLQSKFQHSNVIWIDFDEPVDWQSFEPAPSIVVQTSEEKYHCYWLLQEPITDVNDMRYWCKRFLQFFSGGDESGFDATQLLKLPWGLNLKFKSQNSDGTPWAPKIIKFEPELKYAETAFEEMPEPNAPPIEAVDLSVIPDIPECDGGWQYYVDLHSEKLPKKLVAKLRTSQDGGEEKRSGALFSLIHELLETLGNVEDTFHVLSGSPNDKFTADHGYRGAELLWKDINRVAVKQQKAKADITRSSMIRDIMESKSSFRDKIIEISSNVMTLLKANGEFIQTDFLENYYVDTRTGASKLYVIDRDLASPFAGLLLRRFGMEPEADKHSMTSVIKNSLIECSNQPKTTFRRFAHYELMDNLVYVDRYDGFMYVLDGDSVTLKPYGYKGVYFYPNENDAFPRPFEYVSDYQEGGLDSLILDGPNYTPQGYKISRKELRHLLKTWVASFFFPAIMDTRPIVLIHGAADSGKTTLFQNLSVMLTGDSTFSVTEIPKDVKEFNVQVTQSPYIFYDNVEVNKKEMQEKLAQVATGYTVKQRLLYSNNKMVSTKARSFVGITSRTLERIQDDVAQRYIMVPVTPFASRSDNKRRAMSSILKEVMDSRDVLWSELLDFVNSIVKQIGRHGIQSSNTKLRMADYGGMLDLTASMVGMSSAKMENFILSMQVELVSENEPIFIALEKHIESLSFNPETSYTPKNLYETLGRHHRKLLTTYKSTQSFSKALKGFINNGQLLRFGIAIDIAKSGNNQLFTVRTARPEELENQE